jgi:hypothetical protein
LLPSTSAGVTPSAIVSSGSPAQVDLDNLLANLELIHPDPWHGVTRSTFVAALNELRAQIDSLSPTQQEVAAMRLVAMISANGRDGHMFAVPTAGNDGPILPLRIYEFAGGVYITAAMPGHEELAGSRIIAIGGHPIDEILGAVEPLVPRDGPATVPAFRPIFVLRTDVLRGLGLVGDGPVPVTVVSPGGGTEQTVDLDGVTLDDYTAWAGPAGMVALPARSDTLYLSNLDSIFWTRYLAGSRTLYARYTQVRTPDGDSLAAFADRAAGSDVDRVVLDLRQNRGGDNHTYAQLLTDIEQVGASHASLYVLIDRLTFSAAANLATQIEQHTDATFAGEQMGGGLNFWDDVTWVQLPHLAIPMQVGISRIYWQMSIPDDPRLTITPSIGPPVTAADYFAGRDQTLDAILAQPADLP